LFDKEDSNKQLKRANSGTAATNNNTLPRSMTRCDTLDQGTNAFMQWLSCSQDKQSSSATSMTSNSPIIILKEFVSNKYSILYDNNIGKEVIVETYNGVPRCNTCDVDDCGHVGFTICLEQKYDNEGTVFD
jgi:hypothetical protein